MVKSERGRSNKIVIKDWNVIRLKNVDLLSKISAVPSINLISSSSLDLRQTTVWRRKKLIVLHWAWENKHKDFCFLYEICDVSLREVFASLECSFVEKHIRLLFFFFKKTHTQRIHTTKFVSTSFCLNFREETDEW